MGKFIPAPVGAGYGQLTVLGESLEKVGYWRVRCSCSKEFEVMKPSVRHGNTKSCGCARVVTLVKMKTTHGMRQHPLYGTWADMRKRCLNPSSISYKNYGGRGIAICERWSSFENFVTDMGAKPDKKATLERIHNDQGYSPENCKWDSKYAQSVNQRKSLRYEYRGQLYSIRELGEQAKKFNVTFVAMRSRISKGIPVEQAVETPLARVGWHPKPADGRDRNTRPGVVKVYTSS